MERDPFHDAVFRNLYNPGRAIADLEVQETFHRVAHRLGVGDHVLRTAVRADLAVRPGDDAATGRILFGCDHQGITGRLCSGDGQGVAADRKFNAAFSSEGILAQYAVAVGQARCVSAAVPGQLYRLGARCV